MLGGSLVEALVAINTRLILNWSYQRMIHFYKPVLINTVCLSLRSRTFSVLLNLVLVKHVRRDQNLSDLSIWVIAANFYTLPV